MAAEGYTLSYTDVTIAAVALTHKLVLVTDNQEAFSDAGAAGPHAARRRLDAQSAQPGARAKVTHGTPKRVPQLGYNGN